ncbi:MAG: sugar transferase [Rhodothermales bacterium]|nr:sugar transferase [Rhodothermales bacterium]MBO6781034.1 sugar transferase [Rhodothermales bacterium]
MKSAPTSFYQRRGKRLFDLASSLAALVVLVPILVVVAAISLGVQGRPVLFRQERVGKCKSRFWVIKLRTMRVDPVSTVTITTRADSRITPWGRLLRRSKLDELPQLLNVLNGSMSLVGHRPDVPGYWDELPDSDRLTQLRPGITGPGAVVFRNEELLLSQQADPIGYNDSVIFPEKVRLARLYAESITFAGDLFWIALTLMPSKFVRRVLSTSKWVSSTGAPFWVAALWAESSPFS